MSDETTLPENCGGIVSQQIPETVRNLSQQQKYLLVALGSVKEGLRNTVDLARQLCSWKWRQSSPLPWGEYIYFGQGTSESSIARSLKTLQNKGLVTHDYRFHKYGLTVSGHAIVDSIRKEYAHLRHVCSMFKMLLDAGSPTNEDYSI